MDVSAIQKIITPYQLVQNKMWEKVAPTRKKLPAINALPVVNKILDGYNWGISGSVGFELATQTYSAKTTSDLDLVWKPTHSITKEAAQNLLKELNQYGVHTDLQVIQDKNGFSLEEYANSSSTIMMKTLKNPILVKNPWLKR